MTSAVFVLGGAGIINYRLSLVKAKSLKGFSFDCDNTPQKPCRTLVATHQGKPIKIEPSGIAWSNRYKKAVVVSDNYNDLAVKGAGHYVIVTFDPNAQASLENIVVEPLLTPPQAKQLQLYDLEGATMIGTAQTSSDRERLYVIGSMSLHGKNPKRDRWQRCQFVQMDLVDNFGLIKAINISPVTQRWPDFRDWLIAKSGYPWTGEETRGRAEGDGINVEALSSNSSGNLIMGFRGPVLAEEKVLALEFSLPSSADEEPNLVKKHIIPQVNSVNFPKQAPKTLRGMVEVPNQPDEYYVLLGPKGYEKESIILARWNSNTGELSKATPLPKDIVAEGIAAIGSHKLLVVDDLQEVILIATEN